MFIVAAAGSAWARRRSPHSLAAPGPTCAVRHRPRAVVTPGFSPAVVTVGAAGTPWLIFAVRVVQCSAVSQMRAVTVSAPTATGIVSIELPDVAPRLWWKLPVTSAPSSVICFVPASSPSASDQSICTITGTGGSKGELARMRGGVAVIVTSGPRSSV